MLFTEMISYKFHKSELKKSNKISKNRTRIKSCRNDSENWTTAFGPCGKYSRNSNEGRNVQYTTNKRESPTHASFDIRFTMRVNRRCVLLIVLKVHDQTKYLMIWQFRNHLTRNAKSLFFIYLSYIQSYCWCFFLRNLE